MCIVGKNAEKIKKVRRNTGKKKIIIETLRGGKMSLFKGSSKSLLREVNYKEKEHKRNTKETQKKKITNSTRETVAQM